MCTFLSRLKSSLLKEFAASVNLFEASYPDRRIGSMDPDSVERRIGAVNPDSVERRIGAVDPNSVERRIGAVDPVT